MIICQAVHSFCRVFIEDISVCVRSCFVVYTIQILLVWKLLKPSSNLAGYTHIWKLCQVLWLKIIVNSWNHFDMTVSFMRHIFMFCIFCNSSWAHFSASLSEYFASWIHSVMCPVGQPIAFWTVMDIKDWGEQYPALVFMMGWNYANSTFQIV